MISILVKFVIFINFFITIARPGIGVFVYYLFALITPQNIWFWAFDGIRQLYFIAIPIFIGCLVKFLKNDVKVVYVNSFIFKMLILLYFTFLFSHYMGPYVDIVNEYRFFDSERIFINLTKTIFVVVLAAVSVDNFSNFKLFWCVGVLTSVIMIWWGNMQYFTGADLGRLNGPHGVAVSIYYDENIFGALLVTTLPFLFYSIYLVRYKIFKLAILLAVPFGWHAIFLTGSRGALIALSVSIVLVSIRMKKKLVKILVVPLFAFAVVWQGGDLLWQRAATITQYENERSASGRLEAWAAATNMAAHHPITGVGLGSFGQAFPHFSDKKPRIAHNMFFQLLGECGWGSALLFVSLMFFIIKKLWVPVKEKGESSENMFMWVANESCLVSLVGFLVCALFLSLEQYEFFYYLLLIANYIYVYKNVEDRS